MRTLDAGADQNGPNKPTGSCGHFPSCSQHRIFALGGQQRHSLFSFSRRTGLAAAGVQVKSSSTPHFFSRCTAYEHDLSIFTIKTSQRPHHRYQRPQPFYPLRCQPRALLTFHYLSASYRRIVSAALATARRKLPHSPDRWERMLPHQRTNCCNPCRTCFPRGPQGQDPGGIVGQVQRKSVVNRGRSNHSGNEP